MDLTGEQTEQLQNAILDTYNRSDLEQLLSFKLDERLDNITSGGNMRQIVFELIEWAGRRGRLTDLIQAAHVDRPSNSVFAEFAGKQPPQTEAEPSGHPSIQAQPSPSPTQTAPVQPSGKRSPKQIVGFVVGAIGLIASVLTILTFCQPQRTVAPSDLTPTALAEPTEFTYNVTVIDDETDQPIAKAQVIIEIGGGKAPLDEFADSNGFARVVVPAAFAEQRGRLVVSSGDYKTFVQEIDLYSERLPDVIRLTHR